MLCAATIVVRSTVVLDEPAGAEEAGFLPLMRDEEDRPRGLLRGEALGDLEEHDGAGAVVIRAVADRVEARGADGASPGDEGVDRALLGWGGDAGGIVRPLAPCDGVHRAEGVVVHRGGVHADVIVVRADEHILAREGRVGAGKERDHVAGVLGGRPGEGVGPAGGEARAGGPGGQCGEGTAPEEAARGRL